MNEGTEKKTRDQEAFDKAMRDLERIWMTYFFYPGGGISSSQITALIMLLVERGVLQ